LANPGSIAPIFKRVAQWIGMPEQIVDRVSGHSTRVPATQALARARQDRRRTVLRSFEIAAEAFADVPLDRIA
jgi:DNA-binding transcriptional regulator YhcF (GntR family)